MREFIIRAFGILTALVVAVFALGGATMKAERKRNENIGRKIEGEAAVAKEEVHEQIAQADPRDLIAADPDPAARGAERDAVASAFRERLRDRLKRVVSGSDGA